MRLLFILFTTFISFSSANSQTVTVKKFEGTYAYTPAGDLWEKIQIKGDSATFWYSLPSKGSWGEPRETSAIEIFEERSSVNGEKYYYILFGDRYKRRLHYYPNKPYLMLWFGGRLEKVTKVKSDYNPWR